VWANWADVSYSEHEFTIDFVRMDPREPRGIVVARVSSSSLFVMELIDTLNSVWHDWAKKAMPRRFTELTENRRLIRSDELERLPHPPRDATTDRPVSEDARRIIAAAQREAIRRARKSR
jgi:hypothetical protein